MKYPRWVAMPAAAARAAWAPEVANAGRMDVDIVRLWLAETTRQAEGEGVLTEPYEGGRERLAGSSLTISKAGRSAPGDIAARPEADISESTILVCISQV